MSLKSLRWESVGLVMLLLVWIGIWGAWIPARTASLTQHALYLAEWSTILPESRYGGLAYLAEVLRLSTALAVVALAIGVGMLRSLSARWVIRVLASVPGLVLTSTGLITPSERYLIGLPTEVISAVNTLL